MTDATARVRKYQFGASMCQISPERLGWAMFPALSGSPSIGTPTGAGYHPLMHPVLKWIRSTRIGGFEDCTKVAKIARAANLQSSLPSCNLRERPRSIATTRSDRHNPEDRSNPLHQPSGNRFQTTRRSSSGNWSSAECSTAGVRPRQGLALHTLQRVTDPDPALRFRVVPENGRF